MATVREPVPLWDPRMVFLRVVFWCLQRVDAWAWRWLLRLKGVNRD
jgi:hypothetical protein